MLGNGEIIFPNCTNIDQGDQKFILRLEDLELPTLKSEVAQRNIYESTTSARYLR